MKYIIDRFEENEVICEDENRNKVIIKKSLLPPRIHEGDIILEDGGKFLIDSEETKERKKQMRRRMMDLFE